MATGCVRGARRFVGRLSTAQAPAQAKGQVSPAAGRQTDLQGLGPRRFYNEVGVRAEGDGYAVTLDGSAVRTPQRRPLVVPSAPLGNALAAEWDAQDGRIRPSSMPLTTLATTALDVVPEFRPRIGASLRGYLHTDTACIRPDYPSELVARQDEVLEPLMEYYAKQGVQLQVCRGGLSAVQPESAVSFVDDVIDGANAYELAALDSAAATCKSVLVACALRGGGIDGAQAAACGRSEERWQASVWGLVEGGHDMDDADSEVRLFGADLLFRFIEAERAAFEANAS